MTLLMKPSIVMNASSVVWWVLHGKKKDANVFAYRSNSHVFGDTDRDELTPYHCSVWEKFRVP